ncbi:MAG: type I polyketide synthase, partial [Gammaproteobacteria bacterium]|nr:type I polyketide synthase [Gammaproteobacteria bacterium]
KALYERKGHARPETKHCGLSSVKTNIGHLEAAAGIAGMLKVLLALKHKTLPGTVHLQTVNPQIQLEDSPLYLVKHTTPWQAVEDDAGRPVPRRAGVSSFGFGGANAHVVIEEHEELRITNEELRIGEPHIFVLSAKNEERLKAYAQEMVDFLETAKNAINLTAAAYTLQIGREVMQERLAVVASNVKELAERLRQYSQGKSD